MIKVTKTDEYALFTPDSAVVDDAAAAAMEKSVAVLYSSEGQINYIVDLDKTTSLSVAGVHLFDKIQKITKREAGTFVLVVNNDDVMDVIADNSEFELVMLSSVDEAIEAVYINTQDSEYDDEEEEEFGEENPY
jgi:anti-anti-sigma regulatory factor